MTRTLIEIEDLNLYIDRIPLTTNLSLILAEGARLGITGPSGCGKSTLLKAIVSRKVRGASTFRKFEVANALVSYVPQSNGLLPWFSLKRNLAIYSKEPLTDSEATIQAFELAKNLSSFPHQLSGGEYQRAVLAAAIINRPSIFLADEPLTELDISKKWKLLHYWSNQILASNSSLLLVSHDLETLLYLCDKVIVLSDKPSEIRRVISVRSEHPRPLDFLLSQTFVEAKSELLTFTGDGPSA
jgi:ABC-type nitrate/sulfonate/bicarbonate transport system ATPase subunit